MDFPKPSPNQEAYIKILNDGFKQFPQRLENYNKYLRKLKEGYSSIVDYMPIKMDYEVSAVCNFRCKMCIMQDQNRKLPKQMTYDDYKASLDEQYGLIEVKLQGLGEPLLNKEFFAMVHETVKRYIWVRTTTNGSLLHISDNYKKMIDEKIGEIQVSIDGATKETFESIRVGSNFNQVVENVRMMNMYAESKGEVWRTSCWMLVQKDNFHEIERLLDLAKYMHFKRVVYSISVSDWGGVDNWTTVNGEKDVSQNFTEDLINHMIDIGKKLDINVTFWNDRDKYKYTQNHDELCQWIFSRAYISGNMSIIPCCIISDENSCSLGNALEFQKYWNSSGYVDLRNAHLSASIPSMCRQCYV